MSAALSTTDAAALTLGTLTVQSARGENLRAEIGLPQATAAELNSLAASIASPEVYLAQGMEYSPSANSIAVEVQRHADGTASLRLTSSAPINEPFIDLVLQTQWSAGQVARNYTLLLDAPKTPGAAPAGTVAPQVTTAPPSAKGRRYASKSAPKPRTTTPAPAAGNKRTAVADGSVRVRTGDTAGRIANANRPAGVSLDQMLVAMVRSNPKAFINGNVNRIRAGAVLQVPNREQALETSASEARSIVAAQSRDFNAYRRSLAAKAPKAAVQSAKRSASGKVQAQVAETRPAAEAPDKLTLSKGDSQPATTEAKVATQKQSEDQDNRLSELQRNLAELNELTQQAPVPAPATAPAPATEPAVPPVSTPEVQTEKAAPNASAEVANTTLAQSSPTDTAPPAPVVQDPSTPDIAAVEPSAPPVAAPAEPATEAPTPDKAQDPVPAEQLAPAGDDDLLSNPWVPVGAGLAAALLGLLGFMAWKRRRNASDANKPLLNDKPQHLADPAFGNSQDSQDDAVAADYASNLSVDADPIAEADMYLAYGRDTQAEEILKEALRKQPDHIACSVKLAEIYAKRQDLKALESIARDMNAVGQSNAPEWQRIVDMGRQINPAHPYFASVGLPSAAAPAAADQPLPTSAFAAALDSAKVQGSGAQPSAPTASAQQPSARAPVSPPAAPAPFSEDFQDLGNLDLDLSAFDLPAAPPPAAAPEKDDPFDLFKEPKPATKPQSAPSSKEVDLGSLDLDLDTGPASAAPAQPVHNLSDDPLSTKLDLAQEFNSIGDSEGARSLIEEVLAEARGSIKERAQKMLSELD